MTSKDQNANDVVTGAHVITQRSEALSAFSAFLESKTGQTVTRFNESGMSFGEWFTQETQAPKAQFQMVLSKEEAETFLETQWPAISEAAAWRVLRTALPMRALHFLESRGLRIYSTDNAGREHFVKFEAYNKPYGGAQNARAVYSRDTNTICLFPGSAEDSVPHEAGHAFAWLSTESACPDECREEFFDRSLEAMFSGLKPSESGDLFVTMAATSNAGEFFAECFTAYCNVPTDSRIRAYLAALYPEWKRTYGKDVRSPKMRLAALAPVTYAYLEAHAGTRFVEVR